MKRVEVLGSRILLRPSEPERSRQFYRDTLGLAVYREFGHQNDPGLVFFLGGGFLEVSGQSTHAPGNGLALWIQVRDVEAERRRLLAAGVSVVRGPQQEPWGWWRCGSRIRTAYELFWSRFPTTTRCAGISGDRSPNLAQDVCR